MLTVFPLTQWLETTSIIAVCAQGSEALSPECCHAPFRSTGRTGRAEAVVSMQYTVIATPHGKKQFGGGLITIRHTRHF